MKQPVASFYMETPSGWTTELIKFPIDFAPGIANKGTENLRFAKGWGDIISDEHWCYAFAWWLDGSPVVNETVLTQNLTEYYNGLVNRNTAERKIPKNKMVPTVVSIKDTTAMNGDIASFKGTIYILDYHSENPILLNCMIHIKRCNIKNHTAILFQISPKPFNHLAWKQLNSINDNFNCN